MQGNWVRLTPLDIILNKQAPPRNKQIKILKRPFLPCASCSRFFVLCVVSPSSTGGSAATGSLVKDCHAVRKDPNTLFFKSILIRVKLSFNSTRKKKVNGEYQMKHPTIVFLNQVKQRKTIKPRCILFRPLWCGISIGSTSTSETTIGSIR